MQVTLEHSTLKSATEYKFLNTYQESQNRGEVSITPPPPEKKTVDSERIALRKRQLRFE